jgi:hypothetical protein
MGTTGVVVGTDIILEWNGKPFAHCTSHSMSLERATREISSKDTGDWEEHEYAKGSGSIDFNALTVYDNDTAIASGFDELVAGLIASSKYVAKFGTTEVGDTHIEVDVLITSVKIDAPDKENSTYSGTFKMSGTPSQVVNAS